MSNHNQRLGQLEKEITPIKRAVIETRDRVIELKEKPRNIRYIFRPGNRK